MKIAGAIKNTHQGVWRQEVIVFHIFGLIMKEAGVFTFWTQEADFGIVGCSQVKKLSFHSD